MHEFSVAQSLVEIVRDVAAKEGMNPVQIVHLRVGRLSCIDPEALAMAYQLVTEKTPLEASRLDIKRVAPRAVCRDCGHEFGFPEDFTACCPQCGGVHIDLLQGRELTVDSIEGEIGDGD